MSHVTRTARTQECGGVSRRSLLRCGALTVAGLSLADVLRLESLAGTAVKKEKRSIILLWMDGGPSQHDTFDPKPDAAAEIRGPFSAISTTLPGVAFSEGLPQSARLADRLAIVRSLHHTDGLHEGAIHWMQTGHGYPGEFNPVDRRHPRNPSVGSVVAYSQSKDQNSVANGTLLPYVKVFQDSGYQHSYQGPVFLGRRFEPLMIGSNIRGTAFRETEPLAPRHFQAPALAIPNELTLDRVGHRRQMLSALDGMQRNVEALAFADVDVFRNQAFELLTSRNAQQAFDLSREAASVRERYGQHLWGQGTLLARRLVEAGVRFVTVNLHGDPLVPSPFSWDTHVAHFPAMKDYLLPVFDQLFSALVEDIWNRGLQDRVMVVAVGEFGRSPKIFSDGRDGGPGRAHWPQAFSAVLAGGGIRGGQVIGSTNRDGGEVHDRPVDPQDLLATLYSCFGIDPHALLHDSLNRPFPILSGGNVVRELLA